jgi:hypothetical protein
MKVTLWGQRAAAFTTDGVYDSVQSKPVIVLFVGGLVKSYQGMFCLLIACLVLLCVPLELNFFLRTLDFINLRRTLQVTII